MTNQDKIVIQYLIKKKLPIDLLAEVHDHMMSQIFALQASGDSFEIAFEKTKKCWKDDLKIVSMDDNPLFAKRIFNAHLKGHFIHSIKWGFLVYLLLGVIAYLSNEQYFAYCVYSTSGIVLLLTLYKCFKLSKEMGKMFKKYDNYKLTIFNSLPYSTAFSISSLPQLCFWTDSYFAMYLELMEQNLTIRNLLLSALLILLFTIISMSFYMIKRLELSYQRIQPYLPFLTPNRFYVD